jgi:hypothetical protein
MVQEVLNQRPEGTQLECLGQLLEVRLSLAQSNKVTYTKLRHR